MRGLPSAKADQALATLLLAWSSARMAQGGWELQEHVSCGDSLDSCWGGKLSLEPLWPGAQSQVLTASLALCCLDYRLDGHTV